MSQKVIIGSRGSDLALWQAHTVESWLKNLGLEVEIKIIKTQGDIIQHLSFDKMEGKGFFTKEIEAALLAKDIDLAVHSHKDLETTQPAGLKVAAVSDRHDASELILIRKEALADMPLSIIEKGIIGTSSKRRQVQIADLRPDLEIKDLRGNVPTRINKLRSGDYDAIVLAAAGVERLALDLSDLVVLKLDPKSFVSAPAQGALALQIREDDNALSDVLAKVNNTTVQDCLFVEREVLRNLDGGCQLPLGVYCIKEGDVFKAWLSFYKDGTLIKSAHESTVKEEIVDFFLKQIK